MRLLQTTHTARFTQPGRLDTSQIPPPVADAEAVFIDWPPGSKTVTVTWRTP